MPSCIENIVTLGLCDTESSSSGLTLMQAAGMSPVNGNKIATEVYVTGQNMFNTKKSVALTMFRNDFTAVLEGNNIASTITKREYDSAYFKQHTELGTYAGYRGQVVHGRRTGKRDTLRKLKIKSIQCYPLTSGETTIIIRDYVSGIEQDTEFTVTCVANQLNTFTIEYTAIHDKIMVMVDQTEINFAKSILICNNGCRTGIQNSCADVHGFNGEKIVKENGFGLNVIFACECDYDIIICNFARTFTGELIWLKWQEQVYEEMYKSNRWTAWTTYNRDDIWDNVLPDLRKRYLDKFNAMINGGMFAMLGQYNDNDCLNCRGIVVKTNI